MRLVLHDCDQNSIDYLMNEIARLQRGPGMPVHVTLTTGEQDPPDQRTLKQNASLHLWLRQCAQFLNDAGFDVPTVLTAKTVDVPWDEKSFKLLIFDPIFEAHTGKKSSTEANTTDYDRTGKTLMRHFSQNLAISLPPFPTRHTQGMENV